MTSDTRLQTVIASQPYPLLFVTVSGQEHGTLQDANLDFHRREFLRLLGELEQAGLTSALPEAPSSKAALNDLLVRLRLKPLE